MNLAAGWLLATRRCRFVYAWLGCLQTACATKLHTLRPFSGCLSGLSFMQTKPIERLAQSPKSIRPPQPKQIRQPENRINTFQATSALFGLVIRIARLVKPRQHIFFGRFVVQRNQPCGKRGKDKARHDFIHRGQLGAFEQRIDRFRPQHHHHRARNHAGERAALG